MKTLASYAILITLAIHSLAQVSPIAIGHASNTYSIINIEQNQLVANDSLNTVLFIHRHDPNVTGGVYPGTGILRYDISIDGGNTFTSDLGPLNPIYTIPARFPQAAFFNPPGNTDPANAKLVWIAPTTINGGWDGHVSGTAEVGLGANPSSTETYQFGGQHTLPLGGLTQGLPGEFWTVGFDQNDSLDVYKGIYNPTLQDVEWSLFLTLKPDFDTTYNGNITRSDAIIAFSPDGQTGWIAFMGDIVGGSDTTYNPIFLKSVDAGNTWSSPEELDLRNYPFIPDTLDNFWITILSNGDTVPASNGRPTGGYEFDLTVDSSGNPHMLTVIGSAQFIQQDGSPTELDYEIVPQLKKFICDITTHDGGVSWEPIYVAPILTYRGYFWISAPAVDQIHYPQISRTEDGSKVFYSWVESDSLDDYYGNIRNNRPNLYSAALRISDGFRTCYRGITNGDTIWDERILYPTVSPTVLSIGNTFKVPTVFAEFLRNNPNQAVRFHYLGNEIQWQENNFVHPDSLDLSWTGNANCRGCQLQKPVLTGENISCAGESDGSIQVSGLGNGGFGGPTYSWSHGDSIANPLGLGPGTYAVSISTGPACAVASDSVSLTQPDSLLISFSLQDESEAGDNDGSISVVVNGGVPPYNLQWAHGPQSDSLEDLSPGTYFLTITDSINCTRTDSFVVQPGLLNSIAAYQEGFKAFEVFPNPSKGDFTVAVELTQASAIGIQLFDMNGRVVFEENFPKTTEIRYEVHVPFVGNGIYALQVRTQDGIISERLLIKP